MQLTRQISGSNQLRLRLYRDVSQLDFGDFVSAVEVADDRIMGGNPDLKPTTSWIAELGADIRFGDGAALTLALSHHRIADVADQVVISVPGNATHSPRRFAAPGNIGNGAMTHLEASFSAPLDALLRGARINVSGGLRHAQVTDPISGDRRTIADTARYDYDLEFRHDIPGWQTAWGFGASRKGPTRAFRFDELNTVDQGAFVSAFVETSALPRDLRLRVQIDDIGNRTTSTDRRVFLPDRSGTPSVRELRRTRRSTAPWLLMTLTGKI